MNRLAVFALASSAPLLAQLPSGAPAADAGPAPADEAGSGEALAVEPSDAGDFWRRGELSGAWRGWRSCCEERGISIWASAIAESFSVVSGGLDRATDLASLLDVELDLDLNRLIGWQGATLALEGYDLRGDDVSADAGDFQALSNVALPVDRAQLAQIWYEQWLAGDTFRFKLGKSDVFADFAFSDNAGEFVNTGVSWSPLHGSMPTYPDPAFGALVQWLPRADWAFSLGAFDGASNSGKTTGTLGPATLFGAPSDLYWIGELAHRWRLGRCACAGGAKLGFTHHTGEFSEFDGGTQRGSEVAYLVLDQQLWRENPEAVEDVQGWSAFAMLSLADAGVNPGARHLSAGATRTGAIGGRDEDICGLGCSWIEFSGHAGAGFSADSELALELFYKWQFAGWGSLKPDLQYIVDPGGDASVENALVLGLRCEVAF